MTCVRSAFVPWLVTGALALAGCASDDSGVRALNETTTLRTQLDDMRQRQDTSSREITRLQSQVRALETDAVDKTRDVKAANVELARARVLLEETRGMLREREAAAPSPAAERPTAMPPPAAARPGSPDTASVAPPPPALSTSPAVPSAPPPPVKSAAPRPVAPDPRAIPDSTKMAPEAKPTRGVKTTPEARPAADVKAAPEAKPAPEKAAPKAAPEPKAVREAKPAPEATPPTSKATPEPKAVREVKAAAEAKAPAQMAAPEPKPVLTPSSASKPVVRPVSAAAPSAEKLFSAAMANFRAREHGQAVLELTDLMTRYPSHSLAPAAQLWIGEAYYQQRDYQQALIELRRVSEAYPRSPHVPDALLKIGLCQRALGDRAAASAAWEQAIRDHPGSAAADQARTLLGGRDSAARGTP
ncbi:MAG TPA: tol-pal system protein YbgF [Verrucomicrobiae bacterium]|jgi:tol-pal system protein YbgF|nr:tol-pal system protein YbgF [Verrucomicrobiae bacterium]